MSLDLIGPVAAASTAVLCRLNQATNRTLVLPMLVYYPTSRCNSRCLSCDWWRSSGEDDLAPHEVEAVAESLSGLGTRLVAFSGGEPLSRPDVFDLAHRFRRRGIVLHLLSSGLAIERYASQVGGLFAHVTISLDGATPEQYREIRGVDALAAVEAGVRRLRAEAPHLRVFARSTIHALNYKDVGALINKARAVGFRGLSFLAADFWSDAFGRQGEPASARLRLTADQVADFRAVVERALRTEQEAFASGFVTTTPEKLRRLPDYYSALNGDGALPPVSCNAPWVSVVLEANGDVRPCFFHRAVGNVRAQHLPGIVRGNLRAFRRHLDISANDTCRRCVCSIKVGLRNAPWQ